jgi:glutamate synthase (ferredoxin)
VGTVAVGVAKGLADVFLISGYDGGTGAAPRTSIRHTGLPWELGLAESHQALLLNHMRGRVTLETDGKLLTGRDIAVAALLGAEEFGFATAPLVVMGCVMMRVCDKDTCPVGIATQNPLLRARFAGKPEHIENFMRFIAQDLREWMAKIGVRTLDELVGRTEKLIPRSLGRHWKASNVSLTSLLYQPPAGPDQARTFQSPQRHGLEEAMDSHTLLKVCAPALEDARPVSYKLEVRNINRTVGTLLSGEITKRYGAAGLPEDTVRLDFVGSAGQSFAAFACPGMTMRVEGDVNDYVGKGLSGGKIIVTPGETATYAAADNVVAGNVALYGATAGEAYLCGLAGERFAVRNSGAIAVVEGVGNHGCEYMTGGAVAILGPTGKNFGAGMSGGRAFVYDPEGMMKSRCQSPQLALEKKMDPEDCGLLKGMLKKHLAYTGSSRAAAILADWKHAQRHFVMVIPRAYREMTDLIKNFQSQGDEYEEAAIRAFDRVHFKEQALVGKEKR